MEAILQEPMPSAKAGLENAVRSLHTARVATSALEARLIEKREATILAFNLEHSDLINEVEQSKSGLAALESAVRDAAAQLFEADPTQKKALCPGIGIRETSVYAYDAEKAFAWAMEHKMCLTLDDKSFKTLCKNDSTRPDFVQPGTKIVTTIATDLSGAVAEIEAK